LVVTMSKISESKSTLSHHGTAYDEDLDNDEIVNIKGFWIFRSKVSNISINSDYM